MDRVGSTAPKVTPWGPIPRTLWVQMVQPGQQEQLCEGPPGRPLSATFSSWSAQNQQQKGHRRWGLAFKLLKMQQSSEKQLRNSSSQPGEPQGWPSCAQLAHQGSGSWHFLPSALNSRPTYVTNCSLSALFMDPFWHTVTKNSGLGGGNGPFFLCSGKKKCCKIF